MRWETTERNTGPTGFGGMRSRVEFSSVSSVAQLCPTLCDPMNCSTPRLPVHHQLTGVHSDSHPSSQWCHPAISSSVIPFSSCPQSLPASESFPRVELQFHYLLAYISFLSVRCPPEKNGYNLYCLSYSNTKFFQKITYINVFCKWFYGNHIIFTNHYIYWWMKYVFKLYTVSLSLTLNSNFF